MTNEVSIIFVGYISFCLGIISLVRFIITNYHDSDYLFLAVGFFIYSFILWSI